MIFVHYFPAYWGIERDAEDRSFLTRSTLHEVLPPFRQSTWAFRIRLSHRHWLHIGRFGYQPDVGRWGLGATPDEIGTWGTDDVEEEAPGDIDPESVTLRQLWAGGPGGSAGSDDDEERRTVPWAEPRGDGPKVGPVSA